MTREEAKARLAKEFAGYKDTLNILIDDMYDDFEKTIGYKDEELKQLNTAMGIIACTAGDYTQAIVYDALIKTGYYEEEEEDNDDE